MLVEIVAGMHGERTMQSLRDKHAGACRTRCCWEDHNVFAIRAG